MQGIRWAGSPEACARVAGRGREVEGVVRTIRWWARVGVVALAAALVGAVAETSPATGRARPTQPQGRLQSFHSEPGLHPPVVAFTGHLDGSMGDVFVTAQNIEQPGPMILDPNGRLVWFQPVSRGVPMNLQVQHYQGHPVLTYWVGEFRQWGKDIVLDSSYRQVAVIHGGHGLNADLHEFRITPQGTALIDAYQERPADLSALGGSRHGHVLDGVVQELDMKTGRVLWEWHAFGHVPVSASKEPVTKGQAPFDYFHINSIQQLPNHNLIISARNTWSVYEIDRKTGKILWTLGGKHSSFKMGPGTRFEWQHTAHLTGKTLSLFDDGAAPQEEPQSSGKLLRINSASKTVSLIHRYTHSPSLLANSAGSMQVLRNGNVFVGWGPVPDFSEYTPSGHQIFNGAFVWGTATYRAFRFHWSGHPTTRPALVTSPAPNGGLTLYASWNGATRVRKWQVLDGLLPQHLTADGLPYQRTGFETAIHLDNRPAYVAVQAMAPSGQVLGTSRAVATPLLGSG
jgi:hypothetical protein